MRKKLLLSSIVALMLIGCGLSNSSSSSNTSKTLSGAATDDYLIGSDVKVYDKDGNLVGNCKTKEYGIFNCKLNNTSSSYIVVVSGGKLDEDGNISTTNDQSSFSNKTLAAVVDDNSSVIVSPITTKLVANALGKSITIDDNISYFDGNLDITKLKSSDTNKILKAEKNSQIVTLLKTRDLDLIKENVKQVKKQLDKNISIVNQVTLNNADNFRLQILHVNDTHSHVEPIRIKIKLDGEKTYVYTGGYAKLAKFIKNIKNADSHAIFVHSGDMFQGTLYFNLFNGEVGVKAFNKMPLDAYTLGNHEFDKGEKFLRDNLISKYNFPVVDANINTTDEKLKLFIKDYIVKNIDGQKVGISGITVDSSKISSPGPTIAFANYIDSAEKVVNELKNKGVNKIIFLTHIGYDQDKILATQVPDIDVIVGGHSHTLLGDFSNIGLTSKGNYPTVINHNGSKTLVLQAWKWAQVVGDINVVFDKDGNIIKYSGNPIMLLDDKFLRKNDKGEKVEVNATEKAKIHKLIASMPNVKIQTPDSDVEKIVNEYKPKVDKMMNKVIGYADTDLVHVRLPETVDEDNGKVLQNGSMIAPLVAKAMYLEAKKYGGCDFAIQNAGGIRISISEGNVTMGEIMQMLPFGNTLVTMDMKGSDIKEMIENAVDRSFIQQKNTGAFPYLGNAKFVIDKSKPLGSRIVEFKIKNGDSWEDLDINKTYHIATNSYMANGGDYYQEMVDKATNKYDTGFVYANVFIDYIKQVKELKPLPDDETPVRVVDFSDTLDTPLKSVTFDNGKTLNFTIGYGSSAYHAKNDPANIVYTMSDRGVNIDCKDDEDIIGKDYCKKGKIFPVPEYSPTIYKIEINASSPSNKVKVLEKITLKDKDGNPISGVSNTKFDDTPYDKNGSCLPYDQNGLDTEAMVKTSKGDFWISDEYSPSIVHADSNGKIIVRYVPTGFEGNLSKANYKVEGKLPAILVKRHKNRGIESLALSPDEKYLYFAMQSPLENPDKDTYNKSRFVRLFKMNIDNPSDIKEYVYELDTPDTFKLDDATKQNKVKVSEIRTIGEDKLLVLERISNTTKIYEVDLSKTTPLDSKYDNPNTLPTLEKLGENPNSANDVKNSILSKRLIFSTANWSNYFTPKIEGIGVIEDKLFLINDNDFGIYGDKTHVYEIKFK